MELSYLMYAFLRAYDDNEVSVKYSKIVGNIGTAYFREENYSKIVGNIGTAYFREENLFPLVV
ncbi:hypothetical protein P5673_018388 [Acropora cervicornis]|uniref:Uncharacterized protein n=1 Tax=Acropora cervicornis TaxID=6130 RepID=A0AAD9QDJ6_ACRCE|nr:hypothetical protein P5673_018388 [Acropora cervicornis]